MKIKMIEGSGLWKDGDVFDAIGGEKEGGFSFYVQEFRQDYLSLHSVPTQFAEIIPEDDTNALTIESLKKEILEYRDETPRRERLITELNKEITTLKYENKKLNLIRLTLDL